MTPLTQDEAGLRQHVDEADFLDRVAAQCKDRGASLTAIRREVLALLYRSPKGVKAYDLLELLRVDNARVDQVRRDGGPDEDSAGAAAPPTVYRALDFLLANGFIHKLESVNAFVACHHPNTAQHSVPFLICNRCHSAVELEDREVVAALDERARALGFVPQAQTLEVHGICARCAEAG